MNKPGVFIIHGRDTVPVQEITSFLTAHGLHVQTVKQLAMKKGGLASIQQIVAEGIANADVVFGLLTPDEAVALYDPESGRPSNDCGWQPRPNVIFELGLAFGVAQQRLILATLGNVRNFTDLSGVLFLDLAATNSKADLLSGIVSILSPVKKDFIAGDVDGDFSHASRARWSQYDEVADLRDRLERIHLGFRRLRLIDILARTIAANPHEDWKEPGEYETTAEKFMARLSDEFREKTHSRTVASDSLWHLIVSGFFEHKNIRQWIDDPATWQGTSSLSRISRRGFALIDKLRSLSPPFQPRNRVKTKLTVLKLRQGPPMRRKKA